MAKLITIKKFIGRKTGIGLIVFFLFLFAVYAFEFSNSELLPWYAIMGLAVALLPLFLALMVKLFMKKKNS